MTGAVRELLQSFDALSDSEKKELAAEIVRRSLEFDYPPMSDDDLTKSADELFSDLDRREAEDGESPAG